jgi:hypothetical protein
MDGHTSETICELKNDMIQKMQHLFFDYNRMHEVVLQKTSEEDLKLVTMNQTIRNLHDTDQVRISAIEVLEQDLLKSQKTNHEYSEMIKGLEDKLVAKDKEIVQENKFSMIRVQADEISSKDREIERLNKVILNLKKAQMDTKGNKPGMHHNTCDSAGGWSPTSSKTPEPKKKSGPSVIDAILTRTEETIQKLKGAEDPEEVYEAPASPGGSIHSSDHGEAEEEVAEEEVDEEEVAEEEVAEEEVADEEEAEEAEEEVKMEIFKWKKKEYIRIIDEEEPNVYELLEGDERGNKIGTWALSKTGKKKVTLDV